MSANDGRATGGGQEFRNAGGGEDYHGDMPTAATHRALPVEERIQPASKPLDGIVVVDLSRYLPGPLVGRLLADLGARVIKVEEPEMGDPCRQAPPFTGGTSSLATLLLAGVESIALDLAEEEGREACAELIAGADVLVESFRPGRLAVFGLDPAVLRNKHPKLIVCSVTGWGQDGPHASRSGHDLGYQAVAGGLAPTASVPAFPAADMVGGWSAACSILAALVRRSATGHGCWIDASLLDAAGHVNLTNWADEADSAKPVGVRGPLNGGLAGYQVYRCQDGRYLALAALEPKYWRRFCEAVERKDLVTRQFQATHDEVAAIIAERPRLAWEGFFAEHDIPGEPVLAASESLAHPQVAHRDLLHAAEDGLLRLGFPAKFDGERPRSRSDVPDLGADTERLVEEKHLAPHLTPKQRRGHGIGKKGGLKRWLMKKAAELADRARPKPS